MEEKKPYTFGITLRQRMMTDYFYFWVNYSFGIIGNMSIYPRLQEFFHTQSGDRRSSGESFEDSGLRRLISLHTTVRYICFSFFPHPFLSPSGLMNALVTFALGRACVI